MLIRPDTAKVRREIPHEPGEWVEIRPLTGVELDQARQVTTDKAMAMVAHFPPGYLDSLPKPEGTAETEPDAATLIKYGLVDWSYQESFSGGSRSVPVEETTVALLDGKTRDWLAAEIKALCVRDATSVKESAPA